MNERNLCATVEARYLTQTLPCSVGWAICPWANGGRTWTWCHQWPNADRKHGRCIHCGKTLKELTVRINPKTGKPVAKRGGLAREIAMTPRNVEPVRFVGRAGHHT